MRVRLLSGMVALLVSVSVAMADDAATSVAAGSKAIMFTFSGLSFLGAGSYQNGLSTAGTNAFGGGIGGKYFLTNAIGLRAGLQFGMAHQTDATTLPSGGTDGNYSATLFGISAGGEYHLNINRVSPYAGLQVSFTTTSTTYLHPIDVANGSKITDDNRAAPVLGFLPGATFGVGIPIGVEFFITKEVSLSAEYQLAYNSTMDYDQKTTTVTGAVTSDVKTTVPGQYTFGFQNTGAVTLAVYF
jgi:hypothetical protein